MKLSRNVSPDVTLDEIDLHKADKQLRVFSGTPSVKLLQDREQFIIDDGTNVYHGIRVGNEIKTVLMS